ncbi:uncharacterized protein LOC121406560 [Lytechinus variegatus]|uniref:uncharacterized protein LOC121406560 n=1 Tax=Lytechinus variegatus TaxID=7654 RepID=UPI001BB1BAC3|nr:uncharacterized protein LOC121406560 [Lytechinus variegatus]
MNEGYDYVEVGDLWDKETRSKDSLLARFSGRVLPKDVVSLSSGMWIEFLVNDKIVEYDRRMVEFTVTAEERQVDTKLPCPTQPPRNMSHPASEGNYSNNDYQLWWIQTTSPCNITVYPIEFWLGQQYDLVFLTENIKGPFQRHTSFNLTGRRELQYLQGKAYTSKGKDLVVVFTSNFEVQRPGFTFILSANSTDGKYPTYAPTTEYPSKSQMYQTTSVTTIHIGQEDQEHKTKFSLMVVGVSTVAVAVSALLLVAVVRCYISGSKTGTYSRDSWNKYCPTARSASSGSSLGRFISFFRYPDESFSEGYSSGTLSSNTYSSGSFSGGSSLYSSYTSSSNSYRSSIYARIRTLFSTRHDSDDFSVFRGSPSGNLLSTFHPQSSENTRSESSDEEHPVQTGDPNSYRRLSFRAIRNAFQNQLHRTPMTNLLSVRSSFSRSTDRTSTEGSSQDIYSLVADGEADENNDDSFFTTDTTARMKVQHTYFKGCTLGYDPISQPVQSTANLIPGGLDGAPAMDQQEIILGQHEAGDRARITRPRKILHTYFQGQNRLSSGRCRRSSLGRPLPSIPDRQRGDDDRETLINNVTYETLSVDSKFALDRETGTDSSKLRADDDSVHRHGDRSERDGRNLSGYEASGSTEDHHDESKTKDHLLHHISPQPLNGLACACTVDDNPDDTPFPHSDRIVLTKSNNARSDSNELHDESTSPSEISQLYSKMNKRKILHTYFRGHAQT